MVLKHPITIYFNSPLQLCYFWYITRLFKNTFCSYFLIFYYEILILNLSSNNHDIYLKKEMPKAM